jgi:hypothetical protein
MTIPDWGVHGAILDGIFTNIQQSKANIVVITHTVESELEDGSKRLLPQIGSVNFSRNAAKYFGHVVYLQVANKAHKAGSSTTFSVTAITGSRTDVAIEDMKEPSLKPLFLPRLNGVKEEKKQLEHSAPPLAVVSSSEKPIEEYTTQKITNQGAPPSPAVLSLREKLAALNNGKK